MTKKQKQRRIEADAKLLSETLSIEAIFDLLGEGISLPNVQVSRALLQEPRVYGYSVLVSKFSMPGPTFCGVTLREALFNALVYKLTHERRTKSSYRSAFFPYSPWDRAS